MIGSANSSCRYYICHDSIHLRALKQLFHVFRKYYMMLLLSWLVPILYFPDNFISDFVLVVRTISSSLSVNQQQYNVENPL